MYQRTMSLLYPHLHLRLARPPERRYKPKPPPAPALDHAQHGLRLEFALARVVAETEAQPLPPGIVPERILRVRLTQHVDERLWHAAGFAVLTAEVDRALILFSNDAEMTRFREKVAEYHAGARRSSNQKKSSHSWLASIDPDGIGALTPDDRAGRLLRELLTAGEIEADRRYLLDVELWYLGTQASCMDKLEELRGFLGARGGTLTDWVIRDGPYGLCQIRAAIPGRSVEELLALPSVATVELPPTAGYSVADVLDTDTAISLHVDPPPPDAPRVCVVDSGVATGHPLLAPALGEAWAFPATLGDGTDRHGHGSAVAGIALYDDVGSSQRRRRFRASVRLDAAQVTGDDNRFADDLLITEQMREAITRFRARGCRVFNLSLGDPRTPYQDGRPSPWAETLDNLAHELDIVIVVAAGNYDHCEATGASPGELRRAYPRCLLTPAARIIEPATAANALTVGALAGAGVPHFAQARGPWRVAPAPIAGSDEPSPFTRGGFGVRGAVKPEVVEHGGNWSYSAKNDQLHRGDKGLGVVTLSHHHDDRRLFTVDRGTSMAAPRVAHLAARILQHYPDASANLVRALIAHSCQMPAPLARLPLSSEECLRLVGYGRPDAERALYSTDNRVVMTAEARIQLDDFHVYEVPVPPFFWTTPGRRRITVTLAFDPPVRHRNARYLGSSMCFRLLRNCSLVEIAAAFRRPDGGDRKAKMESRWKTQLVPGATHRDAGTVQHGVWTIRRKPDLQEGESLHLVVVSERGWQRETDAPQAYAIAVSLEHCAKPPGLYDALHRRELVA